MERRSFLAVSAASSMRVLGANDKIRAGIIGAGGRGRYLTAQFKEVGAEMAAVCDVYEPNLEAGLKAASTGAKSFDNYKRLLEDKSLDVVVVATPDHWHAQMTIDAVQAGKDVYVEKPMAHTIPDGFRIVDAVRKSVAQYDARLRHIPSVQENYARAAAGFGVEVTREAVRRGVRISAGSDHVAYGPVRDRASWEFWRQRSTPAERMSSSSPG